MSMHVWLPSHELQLSPHQRREADAISAAAQRARGRAVGRPGRVAWAAAPEGHPKISTNKTCALDTQIVVGLGSPGHFEVDPTPTWVWFGGHGF